MTKRFCDYCDKEVKEISIAFDGPNGTLHFCNGTCAKKYFIKHEKDFNEVLEKMKIDRSRAMKKAALGGRPLIHMAH